MSVKGAKSGIFKDVEDAVNNLNKDSDSFRIKLIKGKEHQCRYR